jgi:hypothetical protein
MYRRKRDSNGKFAKEITPIPTLCACGCNEVVWGKKQYVHGHNRPWLGLSRSEESRKKMSQSHMGLQAKEKHPRFGKKESKETTQKKLANPNYIATRRKCGEFIPTEESRKKMSQSHIGLQTKEKHPMWKGGHKLAIARRRHKRRGRGFVPLTTKNPYNEPIEFHHIHPELPYVVPCPKRIHQMFNGHEKTHYQNVNAMLGFSYDLTL